MDAHRGPQRATQGHTSNPITINTPPPPILAIARARARAIAIAIATAIANANITNISNPNMLCMICVEGKK